jgi:Spy/CpxP family protein refolding chaperone
MSFKAVLVAFALTSGAMVGPLSAQTPATSPLGNLEELMAVAKQAMNPAATALAHREALSLTPGQLSALEALSDSLRPAIEAFATTASSTSPAVTAASAGGTVDREAIRSAYVQQAEKQADVMATIAEAGKQVEAILTPEQRGSLEVLQRDAMLEIIRSAGFAPPTP